MYIRKILMVIGLIGLIWGCSASVDTTKMSKEEHLAYAMKLYNDEDYQQAIQEFESIELQYPGSTVNDDAQYYLGMTYFNREQYLLAAYEFSKLIRNIPASQFVSDSQFMLAECYYKLSPPYQLDQTYTNKAIDEYQAFIDFFPSNPRVDEAEKKMNELTTKLAEKAYNSAVIYQKMDFNEAAIMYYQKVVDTYHDTKFAPEALYNKIKLELDGNMTKDVLADISLFIGRYPDDSRIDEIKQIENSIINQGGNES